MKDQRGVVYLETLVAFVPVFLFFLGTLQIADAGAAHLIVKHAATVAARAAVVVLPDDGVYYNDKDNAQLHQFAGLRRDDIEHAADLVLGANARLDGTSDNVSIGFSAPPVPTPTGETDAEKNRSFGERLLDTSTRGQGEQNMRELVTARVNAKYTCLVAALCSRDLKMVGQASLVYQGARYIYEARTNGARNAARSHNGNGGIVNQADQNNDPDPNSEDGDAPPTQDPDSPPAVAGATPPGDRAPTGSNGGTPNTARPGRPNQGSRPNTSNPASGSIGSSSNASTPNTSAHNNTHPSNPQIVARPPANDPGSAVASSNPPSKPGVPTSSSSAATGGKNSAQTPSPGSAQHHEVAAAAPSKQDTPRAPVAPRDDKASTAQADTSRPGQASASARGPPSSQKIVTGTSSGESGSRTVGGHAAATDTRTGSDPSTILASAASRPTHNPAILGVDSQGRTHLVVTNPACFVAGTQIRTPNGAKRIEAIEAGDRVLAFDVSTQAVVERPVIHSFTRKTHALVDLEIETASATSVITGTPEHPFYLPELAGYVPMGELTPGALLTTDSGQAAHVRSARLRVGDFDVFNFQVAEHHNYFVAAEGGATPGVLVHNAGCDGPRPDAADVDSPRTPVGGGTNRSALTNQEISGHPGPHTVYQVGNAWREPLPEYRNRAPADIPVDGYRRYRMVEVVDSDGVVIAQREERLVEPTNGSNPYWMQRGSASAQAGARLELASDEFNRDLLASNEIAAAFNTQNASGQGFDGVVLTYDDDGNPHVTLVEVKNYPGRYVSLDEFTAVNQNLDQNLTALRTLVEDEAAAETLGLTPEQLDAVRSALDANNIGIEIRPGPGTRIGAGRANPTGNVSNPRVVDALQALLDARNLNGRVSTRPIPQGVVDRIPDPSGVGTRPRFYDLARGPNGEITHDSVHRANAQLSREAQN